MNLQTKKTLSLRVFHILSELIDHLNLMEQNEFNSKAKDQAQLCFEMALKCIQDEPGTQNETAKFN